MGKGKNKVEKKAAVKAAVLKVAKKNSSPLKVAVKPADKSKLNSKAKDVSTVVSSRAKVSLAKAPAQKTAPGKAAAKNTPSKGSFAADLNLAKTKVTTKASSDKLTKGESESGKTEGAKTALRNVKKSPEVGAPSKAKAQEKAELQAVLSQKATQNPAEKAKKEALSAPPSETPEKKIKKPSKSALAKAAQIQEDITNAGKKWLGLYNQLRNSRTKPYDMSASFDVKSGIQHKTLGWGYVVETRGDRMDVLFKDGMKTLVINYVRD